MQANYTVVFPSDTGKNKNGTTITVVQSCTGYHLERTWEGQPKLGRLYVVNVATSAALLFSGNQFAKVARLFNFMRVPFISETTFQTYQNNFLFPVIIGPWETEQQDMFQQANDLDGTVTLVGDGRSDRPGQCTEYGTYTMMELRLGKVIDVQLMQVTHRNISM